MELILSTPQDLKQILKIALAEYFYENKTTTPRFYGHTTIDYFVKNVDISLKLRNILVKNFDYVGQITVEKLFKCRGCGRKTLSEFKEIMNEFNLNF